MKRTLLSVFLVFTLIFVIGPVTWADDIGIEPYASDYLDYYSITLKSNKVGSMQVSVLIDATDVADIVGIQSAYIEYQQNGRWKFYDSLDQSDYPEFFQYDTGTFLHTFTFDGVSGDTYRVTITPYAKIGSGSDTKSLTSTSVRCK